MKAAFKKIVSLGLALAVVTPAILVIFTGSASAGYNSSLLMSDSIFTDTTYSQNDVQNFLNSKSSFLANYHAVEDCGSSGGAHYAFYATYYQCGQSVLASKIISDAARAYNVNPRVIIATLQKEQSLITTPNPSSSQLDCAMGYQSCDGRFVGFFSQVDNGTWQFRTYLELMNGRNWWGYTPDSYPCSTATNLYSTGLYPGRTVTFYNPGGQARTVTLGNSATAALYCYTPHVGPYSETGYSGSYNFVVWYETWFGPVVADGISLGRDAGSPVALVFNQDGRLELVGIADNDSIYHKSQASANSSTWGAWGPIPGALRNIAAETSSSARGQLVGVANNGNVYYSSQASANSPNWAAWGQMDGALSTAAVARNYNGSIQVVGVAANGSIYQKRQNAPDGSDWGAWSQIPGALKGIAADTNADGRIQLVGVASNGSIYTTAQTAVNSTDWSPWAPIDGGLSTAALARNENGTLEIFGTAGNGGIYHKRQSAPNSSSWGSWSPLDGALRTIAAESNNDGRIQLVGVAGNGSIYYSSQTATNGISWGAWTQMDGALRKY